MINFRNIICRHLHRDGHPGKGSIQIGTHPNAGVSFPIGIQSPCRMIGASNHLSKVFTIGSITILRFGDWILVEIIMEGQPGSLRMVNYGLMSIYHSLLPWIWRKISMDSTPNETRGVSKPKNFPTGPRLLCRPNRCPKNWGVGVGVGESLGPLERRCGTFLPNSLAGLGNEVVTPRKFKKNSEFFPWKMIIPKWKCSFSSHQFWGASCETSGVYQI